MARSRLLDLNAGERRKVIHHEEDGTVLIETRQDITNLVKVADYLKEQPQNGDTALGTLVALIPKTELDRAFVEGWFHDEDAWKRWANDPANACYRTSQGTI
jgi:hypothetical protein